MLVQLGTTEDIVAIFFFFLNPPNIAEWLTPCVTLPIVSVPSSFTLFLFLFSLERPWCQTGTDLGLAESSPPVAGAVSNRWECSEGQ